MLAHALTIPKPKIWERLEGGENRGLKEGWGLPVLVATLPLQVVEVQNFCAIPCAKLIKIKINTRHQGTLGLGKCGCCRISSGFIRKPE